MNESRRLQATQSPIIPAVADLMHRHPGTISLGQGVVGYPPPPAAFAAMEHGLSDPHHHKYQSVFGVPPLIDAITRKLAADNGVRAGDDARVMVTAGGNQAFLNAVLAITDPGDEVILPTPYYFNQEMAVTMANARPVTVPVDAQHQLDLAALAAAITPRTRAIVTVSPNNPTGAVYPESALRAVNALCARHGLVHLSDEAYEYFTYDGVRHFSPASIPGSAAHTVSLFSLSKSHGLASWRIGWMVYPATLEGALRKVQDTVIICPPVVSQFAAVGALSTGRPFIAEKQQALAAVRAIVQAELAPLAREGLADVPPADGAFYFFLRVHTPLTPFALVERLVRDHGVAVIPGSAFGAAQGCTLRVAYGALAPETAREGIGRLVAGLRAIVTPRH